LTTESLLGIFCPGVGALSPLVFVPRHGWCDNGEPDWDFWILAMCDDHNGNPTGGFVSPIVPTTEVATAYCQWGYISGAVVWDVIPPEDGGGDEGGDDGGGPGDCPLCPPCPGCPIP